MSTILCDSGGSPLIDGSGKLLFCDETTRAHQQINNVLSTFAGSEALDPEYGVHFEILPSVSTSGYPIVTLTNIFRDALNIDKLNAIKSINSLDVQISGSTAYISIIFNKTEEANVSYNVD